MHASKAKAKAKAKATPRKKVVPEYYPESDNPESEEEIVRPPPRRTRGKTTAVIEDDVEDFGDAMAAIPDVDDSVEDTTLESSGPPARNVGRRKTGTASAAPPANRGRKTSGTAAKKRARAESDSSDAVTFRGSAAGKKRSKR